MCQLLKIAGEETILPTTSLSRRQWSFMHGSFNRAILPLMVLCKTLWVNHLECGLLYMMQTLRISSTPTRGSSQRLVSHEANFWWLPLSFPSKFLSILFWLGHCAMAHWCDVDGLQVCRSGTLGRNIGQLGDLSQLCLVTIVRVLFEIFLHWFVASSCWRQTVGKGGCLPRSTGLASMGIGMLARQIPSLIQPALFYALKCPYQTAQSQPIFQDKCSCNAALFDSPTRVHWC